MTTNTNQEAKNNFFTTQINVQGEIKNHSAQEQNYQQQKQQNESPIKQQQINDVSEELKILLQHFNAYDKKQVGMCPLENIRQILTKLEYPLDQFDEIAKFCIMTKEGYATFDQFLAILSQIEKNGEEVDESKLFVKRQLKTDPRLISFLRLLDEYRKKCQKQGNYNEAKKSKLKIEEIKQKQSIRKRNTLKLVHNSQLTNIEKIQKKQFQQFSQSWDKFMTEYEQAALQSLEKLKQKHIKDLEEYTNKVREQLSAKMYYSKYILQLRTKQKNLVKLQQYEQAQKIRVKIQILEQQEKKKRQLEISQILQMRVANFRKQQTSVLNALLKRIQKDRNQQLRQRQIDSQKLIIKNRNIRNDLSHKHQDQIKKAVQSLRQFVLTHQAQQRKVNIIDKKVKPKS